jgi:hypothetical protein
MKNLKKILILMLLISTILTSCNTSRKGKWSTSDRNKFYKEMKKVSSSLGNLDEENKTKFIDLYFKKCQNNFSSFAEADEDEDGCEKLALASSEEILANGSIKGNWSADDKKKFRTTMNGVKELDNFGNNKKAWIECFLRKCEQTFESFYEADNDEIESEKIASECSVELFN